MRWIPRRKCKVDECDFGRSFRRVVWIGQFGGDVELEILMVRNDGITELDYQTSLLPESLVTSKQTNKNNLIVETDIINSPPSSTYHHILHHRHHHRFPCPALNLCVRFI